MELYVTKDSYVIASSPKCRQNVLVRQIQMKNQYYNKFGFPAYPSKKNTSSPGIMVLNSFTANGDRLQMFGMGSKTDKSHSLKDLFYDLPSQATNLIMVQRKRCCNGFSPMITKLDSDNLYHGKRHRKKKSGLEVLFDTTWTPFYVTDLDVTYCLWSSIPFDQLVSTSTIQRTDYFIVQIFLYRSFSLSRRHAPRTLLISPRSFKK